MAPEALASDERVQLPLASVDLVSSDHTADESQDWCTPWSWRTSWGRRTRQLPTARPITDASPGAASNRVLPGADVPTQNPQA